MRRDYLKVEQDGIARPGHGAAAGEPAVGHGPGTQAEDGAIASNPNSAYCVPNGHPRIAHPCGQRIQIDGKWLPVRCGDPEPGDPGGEIGKLDHPAPAFGRVFDHPPRLRSFGTDRGIHTDLGDGGPGRVPRQSYSKGAFGHPDVVEFDQRRLAALRALPDAQHLLIVHAAIAVLDQLNGWALQLDAAQHHLPGDQVGQPIAHPRPGQVSQQHPAGVAHDQVFQCEIVDEGAGDGAHLHRTDHDPIQQPRDRPGQEIPSRRGQGHRRDHPEHHGNGANDEHEEEAGELTPHQKGCPTAIWMVYL